MALVLPLTIYSAVDLYAHEFVALYVFKVGGIANYFGSILVGLGHIALLMLLLRGGYVQKLFAAICCCRPHGFEQLSDAFCAP